MTQHEANMSQHGGQHEPTQSQHGAIETQKSQKFPSSESVKFQVIQHIPGFGPYKQDTIRISNPDFKSRSQIQTSNPDLQSQISNPNLKSQNL